MKQRPLLHLPVVSFLLSLMSLTSLAGNRYDFNFNVSRPVDATGATVCPVHATLLRTAIGVTDPATANLVASYKTSSGEERFRTTNTPGLASGQQGHWFDLSGVPTNRAAQRAALVLWDKAALNVTHGELATEGTSLTVVEGLVNGQDSVFSISMLRWPLPDRLRVSPLTSPSLWGVAVRPMAGWCDRSCKRTMRSLWSKTSSR